MGGRSKTLIKSLSWSESATRKFRDQGECASRVQIIIAEMLGTSLKKKKIIIIFNLNKIK